MFRVALLLSLLLSSVAFGQADQFASRIEVAAGKLVVLTAEEADSIEWKLVNPPADDNHQVCDTRVIFSTGLSGEYWFVESGASIVDGSIKQKTRLHLVKVGQSPAPPPSPPGPGPTPAPVPLPAGRFGLAEPVRAIVVATPGIDRKLANSLASDFGFVANRIRIGSTSNFAEANSQLKAMTIATRQGVEAQWKPVTDLIGARLNELVTTKKLVTTNLLDVAVAFEEIQTGLIAGAK